MKQRTIALLMICTLLSGHAYAGSLTDPTRPANARTATPVAPNTIRVEAIVMSGLFQWAIINGTVVHAGDHIANATIDDISQYSVRYTRNGHSEVALLPHTTLIIRRNDTPAEDTP